jgi:hypothetical protein
MFILQRPVQVRSNVIYKFRQHASNLFFNNGHLGVSSTPWDILWQTIPYFINPDLELILSQVNTNPVCSQDTLVPYSYPVS